MVDDFGIEYVGNDHANYLIQMLTPYYDITIDWKGDKFLGIDLDWDYHKRTVRLSMKNYIVKVLQHFQHKPASKPTHSPHPHNEPTYGKTIQYAPATDKLPLLSSDDKTKLQAITGALLYYAQAVDNKILVALGSIATQTHAPTKKTADIVNHLLNYLATYSNDGIIYQKSHMQLATHSDAGYLNKAKA